MEAERKNFYKHLISYCIFFDNKKCFPLLTFKVFLPNPDASDLQPAVSNFAAHGHDRCLCNIGTRSKPCDVSWLF